jgi:hypothetical protein
MKIDGLTRAIFIACIIRGSWMIRALVIDDAAKAKAARVLAHAEGHHYFPERTMLLPGDDERFVARFNDYRAVFSYTHSDGAVWRHLSISVPARGKYPHMGAAFVIANLFGFTGWDRRTVDALPEGWLANVNEDDNCIILLVGVNYDTLMKNYREDFQYGREHIELGVANKLVAAATAPEHTSPTITAAMFYAKTRMGFTERSAVEVKGEIAATILPGMTQQDAVHRYLDSLKIISLPAQKVANGGADS